MLLNNESITSVSIDEGLLNAGILANWIKKYKENCYNIVERKRGRPTMKNKVTKVKTNETDKEKIKSLKQSKENKLQKINISLKAADPATVHPHKKSDLQHLYKDKLPVHFPAKKPLP